MRRGEVLGLRSSDVDLDAMELKVEQTLEQTKKTGCALSSQRRSGAAEERLALGIGGANDWLVFIRYDGETINPRHFSKEFSRLMKADSVGKITFHGLRHTHITHLLRSGEHVKAVSERAGHANVAITLQIYGRAIPGMQRELAARMDAALRGVVQNAE